MTSFFKKPWLWLLAFSLLLHFVFSNLPNQVVFDEVTFVRFINAYLKGEYYFDLHPPLGKMFFAIMAYFTDWNPNLSYAKIGDSYADQPIQALRLIPLLCGALLPVLVYWLCRGLQLSIRVALLAGTLVLLDNALLVISKFVLLDIFLVFFGFLALALYFESRKRPQKILYFWLACLAASAAFLIKWTGLSFLGMIFFLEIFYPAQNRSIKKLIIGSLIFASFYIFIFWPHFELLPKSGQGDLFMSPTFRETLSFDGKAPVNPNSRTFIGKFLDLNQAMWDYHQTMHQSHPYSSSLEAWPWMKRPIYFWTETKGSETARIYFLGNPLLWWGGFLSLLFLAWIFGAKYFNKKAPALDFASSMILLGFAANFFPFILIGRLTFLYHYIPGLVFSIIALAILVEKYLKTNKRIAVFAGIAFIVFIFFAPLSYGWLLNAEEYHWRIWLSSWI